jgi:hypothetical protein
MFINYIKSKNPNEDMHNWTVSGTPEAAGISGVSMCIKWMFLI